MSDDMDGSFVDVAARPDVWAFNERLLDGEPSSSSLSESEHSGLENSLNSALHMLQEERARNARLELSLDVARALSGQRISPRVECAVSYLQSCVRGWEGRKRAAERRAAGRTIHWGVHRWHAARHAERALTNQIASTTIQRAFRAYAEFRLAPVTKTQLLQQMSRAAACIAALQWRAASVQEEHAAEVAALEAKMERERKEVRKSSEVSAKKRAADVADLQLPLAKAHAALAESLRQAKHELAREAKRANAAAAANIDLAEQARANAQNVFRLESENAALSARVDELLAEKLRLEETASSLLAEKLQGGGQ